jgi:hypothetical protein
MHTTDVPVGTVPASHMVASLHEPLTALAQRCVHAALDAAAAAPPAGTTPRAGAPGVATGPSVHAAARHAGSSALAILFTTMVLSIPPGRVATERRGVCHASIGNGLQIGSSERRPSASA